MSFEEQWWASGTSPLNPQGPNGDGIEIPNSLRFKGYQNLFWDRGAAPAESHDGTNNYVSMWVKRSTVGRLDGLFAWKLQSSASAPIVQATIGDWRANVSDVMYFRNIAATLDDNYKSQSVFRDTNAWMHIFLKQEGSGANTISRDLWVNGVLQTSEFNFLNGNNPFRYFSVGGCLADGASLSVVNNFYGYIAEFHFIQTTDGTTVAASDFGKYNNKRVWVPKEYTGSHGANGFYLDFSDPADIGADRSGNGNNFTANGFELTDASSTDYDFVIDTPTSNAPTLNSLTIDNQGIQFNANMSGAHDTASRWSTHTFTQLPETGKYYWEVKHNNLPGRAQGVGVVNLDTLGGIDPYRSFLAYVPTYGQYLYDSYWLGTGYFSNTGRVYANNNISTPIDDGSNIITYPTVIGVAFDVDAGEIQFFGDNVKVSNTITLAAGRWLPAVSVYSPNTGAGGSWVYINAGQQDFDFAPPAGYQPLRLANNVAPTLPATISGSFTGNNTADGPFVYTGCVPGRIQYGAIDVLYQDRLNQSDVDFLCNGFKVRSAASNSGIVNYTVTTTHTGGEYSGRQIAFSASNNAIFN